jgi:hypothetical protein
VFSLIAPGARGRRYGSTRQCTSIAGLHAGSAGIAGVGLIDKENKTKSTGG